VASAGLCGIVGGRVNSALNAPESSDPKQGRKHSAGARVAAKRRSNYSLKLTGASASFIGNLDVFRYSVPAA
jgi:hypothetical protein